MAVIIRLKRIGTTQKSRYRIVVSNSRTPRDGRFIECIGFYDPTREPTQVEVDQARALEWVKNGAIVSQTVASILKRKGISL